MGIMDIAKGLLGDQAGQVDGAVDTAADAVTGLAPDQLDGAVDQVADLAKDAFKGLFG
jgi:MT0933-like antitoxin protein